MITLSKLPLVMQKRAMWARETIINNPEKSEIDYDEMLAWVYNEEDNLWYSIDGNYSQKSPSEKMLKRAEYEKRMDENAVKYKQEWDAKYHEIVYWSKIREQVLKRDNYICQICFKIASSKLHVHHVLKKREKGEDYFDLLITVCPPCHKQADIKLYNPDWKKQ